MKAKTPVKPKDDLSVVRNSHAHRLLALKVAAQAKRVLPIFEKESSNNDRPRLAIEATKAWGQGKRELGMVAVRKLLLDAHAAARGAKTNAARFAARAAGQAIAVWHAPNHALVVPYYTRGVLAENKFSLLYNVT